LLPGERALIPAPPGLDAAWSLFRYQEPLRGLLLRWKYAGDGHPGAALAGLIAAEAPEPMDLGWPDAVVPVPASGRARRKRGFDQARVLGRALARELGSVHLPGALRRRLKRPPQATLGGAERRRSLVGAFHAGGVFGRALLLVDDVSTTGATLIESARALRAAGARRVVALTLCRA
jgi:ComF family protein